MAKVKDGIIGLCVGDALGVPVEFRSRQALEQSPLTDMTGFGSHNQPAGTWSDDSSLTFCLMDSLAECREIDLVDLAGKFGEWCWRAKWTPHDEVFDIGIATREAIIRLEDAALPPQLAGGSDEFSNGNGSLMRILPLAYYLEGHSFEERIHAVTRISSLTHRHPISIIACVIYVEIAISLIEGKHLEDSLDQAKEAVARHYALSPELSAFDRVMQGDLKRLGRNEIQSSGYVVHTLEASLWCLMNSGSYEEAVLKAINLGEDTDTTGAVTGGLAGLMYGLDGIRKSWIIQLARLEEIMGLCDRFEEAIEQRK
ncbi:ADP-ribosylglycohydrolase family protein [Paenibacillus sepulcri]|uniref:ADP-ribosylglycohydrolase family protein n=1 Tax=Paenibacillus sepulcri TaxID=359917 RepID=A0ABS7C282_9BACL|nr:ADP-ribosylglycohydrolase family protein [Paenibacillus sepulcri]